MMSFWSVSAHFDAADEPPVVADRWMISGDVAGGDKCGGRAVCGGDACWGRAVCGGDGPDVGHRVYPHVGQLLRERGKLPSAEAKFEELLAVRVSALAR